MVLPLYLALTAAEIAASSPIAFPCAYMACHFSPYTEGLSGIPDSLPEDSILILNDRMNCQGHSADLVAGQLRDAVGKLRCNSLLLDFQRPPEAESIAMVNTIVSTLPCPVAVAEGFAKGQSCPVFLSPAPLHIPLEQYLDPWKGREIWLEAALCQEEIAVTETGVEYTPFFPTEELSGGFYEETLHCRYHTEVIPERIHFTLFDTRESLETKLEYARSLGIARAVGLWQELGKM